jgi:hypothetical protein
MLGDSGTLKDIVQNIIFHRMSAGEELNSNCFDTIIIAHGISGRPFVAETHTASAWLSDMRRLRNKSWINIIIHNPIMCRSLFLKNVNKSRFVFYNTKIYAF